MKLFPWPLVLHAACIALGEHAKDSASELPSRLDKRGRRPGNAASTSAGILNRLQDVGSLPPGAHAHGLRCMPPKMHGGVYCEFFDTGPTARFHLLCRPVTSDGLRFAANQPADYIDGRCPREHFCAAYFPETGGRLAGLWSPKSKRPRPQIRCVYMPGFIESETRTSKCDRRRQYRRNAAAAAAHALPVPLLSQANAQAAAAAASLEVAASPLLAPTSVEVALRSQARTPASASTPLSGSELAAEAASTSTPPESETDDIFAGLADIITDPRHLDLDSSTWDATAYLFRHDRCD